MLNLRVKSRDKLIFDGAVDYLSGYNKVGLFSVLDDHSNFISLLENKIIAFQRGAKTEIPLTNGLMKVTGNKIVVYIGVK